MPEYLAPGVYVEETSFRSKSIEGVSTTTTGFIGASRYGPVTETPEILTSLGEFERIYGDGQALKFGATVQHNFLWHGVRAFFSEGGKRLYVSRVFRPLPLKADGTEETDATKVAAYTPPAATVASDSSVKGTADPFTDLYADGHGRKWLPTDPANPAARATSVLIRARNPGAMGNLRVRITAQLGQNILGRVQGQITLGAIVANDLVRIERAGVIPAGEPEPGLYSYAFNAAQNKWFFQGTADVDLSALNPELYRVRIVTLGVETLAASGLSTFVATGFAPHPSHTNNGAADSIFAVFSAQALEMPLAILPGASISNGRAALGAIFGDVAAMFAGASLNTTLEVTLSGGNDGLRPGPTEVEGANNPDLPYKTGLRQLEDLEDISIVAAPGSMWPYESEADKNAADTISNLLIIHAQSMRYRIAVLDSAQGQTISAVRKMRAKMDSKYAALYYPWVRIFDPITRDDILLPPSGFVAGIYARNDINRAVWKAPANEVVNLALGFEVFLNKGQQDVLNPEGINCFRFFEGRGMLLWGARTISSDPEWKYVNLRRYFAYLERSIDKGTQWAVFEPNGEALWANVRRTIEDFLLNEWMMGALLGDKPEKAYFVKCDRSTMTQNDLDNGRLICLIGVAPLRPAEFVIFRIGQWTGDRRV